MYANIRNMGVSRTSAVGLLCGSYPTVHLDPTTALALASNGRAGPAGSVGPAQSTLPRLAMVQTLSRRLTVNVHMRTIRSARPGSMSVITNRAAQLITQSSFFRQSRRGNLFTILARSALWAEDADSPASARQTCTLLEALLCRVGSAN